MVFFFQSTQLPQFTHLKFIFLLIIVLNTLETLNHITKPQFTLRNYFENDLKYCNKCFETQITNCLNIFEQIEEEQDLTLSHLLALIPHIAPRKRQNHLIKLKNSELKIITKTFFHKKFVQLKNNFEQEEIKKEFIQNIENLQGIQYAPLKSLDEFIRYLQQHHDRLTEISLLLYMLINMQALILPVLYQRNFPVPQLYAQCGFTSFQEYAGKDLYYFFKEDFQIKLQIAQQLLKAALKFSYGFDNYRIYITDLTADNIVYDAKSNKLTFIDLDTIFIVDSSEAIYKSKIHKHQYIECSGCFAYSADDIAAYNVSDLNVYSACQFLREDLYRDLTKGFLYPIPQIIIEKYSYLEHLLHECVDCPDNICRERLTVAEELIKIFQQIIKAASQKEVT